MYGTAQWINQNSKIFVVLAQVACTLVVCGSMQPEHKMPKSLVQYSIILNCYADTIFVVPDLGTD